MRIHSAYLQSLFIFSLVSFWPVAFYMFALGWGLLLNLAIMLTPGTGVTMSYSYSLLLVEFIVWFTPIPIVLGAHHLFFRANNWRKRGLFLYGSWLLLILLMAFVLSAAIGGVSMATVEGVAGTVSQRYTSYMFSALTILAYAHVVLIPWILICIIFLKQIGRDKSIWQ